MPAAPTGKLYLVPAPLDLDPDPVEPRLIERPGEAQVWAEWERRRRHFAQR